MNCPPSHELSHAISDGADPAIEAHLAACPTCTKEWAATLEMIEHARRFTAPLPSAAHREGVRTALLAASRTQSLTDSLPAHRRRIDRRIAISTAIAVAAGLAIYVAARPGAPTAGHVHGSINALVGAQYLQVSSAPDERIVLTEGSIDVQVSPLHRGERFRIILGDAEVEVHGTRFIATAEHGSLVGVVVDHGVVEVRPSTGATRMLHAGEAWRPTLTGHVESPAALAPPVEEPAPTGPPPSPAVDSGAGRPMQVATAPLSSTAEKRAARDANLGDAKPPAPEATAAGSQLSANPTAAGNAVASNAKLTTSDAKSPAPETTTPASHSSATPANPTAAGTAPSDATPQEREYDSAWTAMRTGKFDDAATAFRKVLLLDPVGPLAEDATYWNAVALARSKQSARAIAAFRDFLDHYAHAKRAGEASAMLGWLLVSSGNRDEAVRRFRAAVDDADEAVRTSARAGLDALTIK